MKSLVPFPCKGLGVYVPLLSVLKDRTEVLVRVYYFHRFTVYLDSDRSVPLSSQIFYHLFSFAHIQVEVRIITLIYEIEGRAVTILLMLKERKQSNVISKLNQAAVFLFNSAIICMQNVEEGRKDTTRGGGGGNKCRCQHALRTTC